jgi:hypothetical protein
MRNPFGHSGGRGRPFSQTAKEFGEFLKAIATISTANPTLTSDDGIAARLNKPPYYPDLSQRQLRRKVKAALDWELSVLQAGPLSLWPKVFGIDPPEATSRRHLRAKALEHLRSELRRHNKRNEN